KLPFEPVFEAVRDGLTREMVARFTFGELPAHRLVFVNGHYSAELSSPGSHARGVVVTSLAAAIGSDSEPIQKHLARYAQSENNAFTALNTAFFQDGAFIYVPAGRILEVPIHLLFISTSKEPGATSHPRNLIVVEN